MCYSLNVPDAASEEFNNGDIFVQIVGPPSASWIGFGTGTAMDGSTMFIVYANGKGNVTLAARKGKGHAAMSTEDDTRIDIQASLLEGSGAWADNITANIHCRSCTNEG